MTAIAILGLATVTSAQVPSYVPSNGLVGWWPFNGNANDESGNGNNGSIFGASLTTDRFGLSGSAYNFDGIDDYISSTPALPTGSMPRSVSCWFKTTAGAIPTSQYPNIQAMTGWGNPFAGSVIFPQFIQAPSGVAYFESGSGGNQLFSQNAVNDGIWHQIITTYDGANGRVKVYIDGIVQDSSSFVTLGTASSYFGIGNISWTNVPFLGQIDDVGLWNRALSPCEIVALYNGQNPTQPTTACYETATFNTTTCQWDVTGTQPTQPTTACYQTATFNSTTCQWDVTGTQPTQPATACYETATFNTTTCQWDVTGTQPTQPTTACYETATFNTSTCQWDVIGTQPTQPTTACYETATFNTSTCQWDVIGTQPTQPTTACYETATFNTSTCQWDVTGTQPTQPTTACYETATFNTSTCQWDVTGSQPTQPTTACYETVTFNTSTCQWDVTGTPASISQPTNQTINVNNNAQFDVGSSAPSATYQWQTDLGVGFQNLNSVGQYSGTTTNTLTVLNVTMSNNNQPFRCIVNSGSCSDTSNVAVLTVNNNVGINEISQDNLFTVFPNPAQSVINVKADSKLIGEIYSIYDNSGRIVLTGKINSKDTTIELGNLSGGIYMLSVGENMKQTFKVIKE